MANPTDGADTGSAQSLRNSSGEVEPIVDQWYIREDTQQKFVVTDYDEDAGLIEIQTSTGDLDELEQEEWDSMPLSLTEASQDWTESIDNEPADDDVKPGPDEGGAGPQDEDPGVSVVK